MPRAQNVSAENNFVGGLKTEFTGLNFPENACTSTSNCVFSRIGNVRRRLGFDYESNHVFSAINRVGFAISSFIWNNADGSGTTNLYVLQVGGSLHFYRMSSATIADPLSDQKLGGVIFISDFLATGSASIDTTVECQFTSGGGNLFVFHPNADPFYVSYSAGNVTGTRITIEIRDFEGVNDGMTVTQTSVTLTDLHEYNLTNQGWFRGTVYLNQFFTQLGFYPSNADVWWYYKGPDVDDDGREKFLPSTYRALLSRGFSQAPKGGHILQAFNQDRSTVSNVPNIPIVTSGGNRPSTGAFHAGRVFYAGLTAKNFNNKIYFSQIIENPNQYGRCYQTNDPTSEKADLLPSDGGVISLQDADIIYKLISVQNGLLVFASNGIWFITGSQGIGFTANDYTPTKISSIQSLSGTSFVNVQGYPVWWNEEGIYALTPSEGGALIPKSITDASIASFYADIPITSKRSARGDYNPLTTTIQWLYRNTVELNITEKYEFDGILNFSTLTQAFYPWSHSAAPIHIHDIKFIPSPGGLTSPGPVFKYLTSDSSINFTFSEEKSTTYMDWTTDPYTSHFVTGYKLHGQAQRKFQTNYIMMFSDNSEDTSYIIQGIWNYGSHTDSGRFTSPQFIHIAQDDFRHAFRKHKIRGHGIALQFAITSVSGEPFNIMGWSAWETINQKV